MSISDTIAAVAVLLSHIDKNAEAAKNPASNLPGDSSAFGPSVEDTKTRRASRVCKLVVFFHLFMHAREGGKQETSKTNKHSRKEDVHKTKEVKSYFITTIYALDQL